MEGIDTSIGDGDDCCWLYKALIVNDHSRHSCLISTNKLYFLESVDSELFVHFDHLQDNVEMSIDLSYSVDFDSRIAIVELYFLHFGLIDSRFLFPRRPLLLPVSIFPAVFPFDVVSSCVGTAEAISD